ncbi:MAG: hypothetical protein VX228_05625 [Pseudomonadota bacterium]|nr:hypothetical protein [Pseudomonadota bacterium]
MRFIRDIIAEKTQAASQDETQALRYPLQLREQDRADVAPRQTPSVHIEAQEPPTSEDPAAQFTSPQPAAVPEDPKGTTIVRVICDKSVVNLPTIPVQHVVFR